MKVLSCSSNIFWGTEARRQEDRVESHTDVAKARRHAVSTQEKGILGWWEGKMAPLVAGYCKRADESALHRIKTVEHDRSHSSKDSA